MWQLSARFIHLLCHNSLDSFKFLKKEMFYVACFASVRQDFQGDRVTVGVCASGLMVYKDRVRIRRYAWVRIMKVTYKGCNFYVSLRPVKVCVSSSVHVIWSFASRSADVERGQSAEPIRIRSAFEFLQYK
jgi:hypothetical protein